MGFLEDVNMDLVSMIVVALLAISEVLGTFEVFKNNSVYQLVVDLLNRLATMLGVSVEDEKKEENTIGINKKNNSKK